MSDAVDDQGFTLIELLVVVIIVGILAAIAIPTYLNQREKAYTVQAVHDMRKTVGAVESYLAEDSRHSYADVNGVTEASSLLVGSGMATSEWTRLTIRADSDGYCIEGEHRLTNAALRFDKATGVVETGAPATLAC